MSRLTPSGIPIPRHPANALFHALKGMQRMPSWDEYERAGVTRRAEIRDTWDAIGRGTGPNSIAAAQLYIRAGSEIRRRRQCR